MTKAIVGTGVVLTALLMGVVLWGRDRARLPRQSSEEVPSPTLSVTSEPNSERSQTKSEQPEPSYTKLNFAFAWLPDKGIARMGYYDPEAAAYYAWKGVAFPVQHVPGFDSWFQGLPLDMRALKVTEVEPPPAYYIPLPDGEFAPGFYDKGFSSRFYRWKGIHLKKDQIPAAILKKYAIPDGEVKYPILIDPPHYAIK